MNTSNTSTSLADQQALYARYLEESVQQIVEFNVWATSKKVMRDEDSVR